MASGLPLVPFFHAVHTVVDRADAVSVRGSEPPNHPLVFVGALVALPHSVESQDDLHARCAFGASCMVGDMAEDLAGQDAGE